MVMVWDGAVGTATETNRHACHPWGLVIEFVIGLLKDVDQLLRGHGPKAGSLDTSHGP